MLIKAFLIELLLYESMDSTSDVDFREFTSSSGTSLPTEKSAERMALKSSTSFVCVRVCVYMVHMFSECKDE